MTQLDRAIQHRLHPTSPRAPLVEVTKPGITKMVTITAGVGFALALLKDHVSWDLTASVGIPTLFGTALSAAGANALNQWMERERDALMDRTCMRPIPTGRLTPLTVLALGLALAVAGVGILFATAGWLPALLSLTCVVTYIGLYTPMKTRTTLSTLVGAIPGALPPLIGWTAASPQPPIPSLFEAGGMLLFSIMFVWQIPHFLAIAWMYRVDYAKGGYRVLPVLDPEGRITARSILLWTIALAPLAIAPGFALPETLGWPFVVVASVVSLFFIRVAFRLWRSRSRDDAKRVFFASIIHLPILLVAMVLIALVRSVL
ncbi:MAG: heme o synthase [Phycisphaerales bacterium]|nr:heme o synthase [Phycisphaerales bacterium]